MKPFAPLGFGMLLAGVAFSQEPPPPPGEPELAPGSRLVDPRADELVKQMSEPPADVTETFRSATWFVWVNGQMQANGPADYDIVNALQKQHKLTPLSAWGQPCAPPAEVPVAAGVDSKTPPLKRVQKMGRILRKARATDEGQPAGAR